MAAVNVLNISVLDNPTAFTNPLQFEVTFECLTKLSDDLEWRVTYVGSAESDQHDQELECVLVGPVPVGMNKFVLHTEAPKPDNIPIEDLLGVTVVLITCSYKSREFIRVGYYVNNSHPDYPNLDVEDDDDADMEADEAEEGGASSPSPEEEKQKPAVKVDIADYSTIKRNILAAKPRVTRFPIDWT